MVSPACSSRAPTRARKARFSSDDSGEKEGGVHGGEYFEGLFTAAVAMQDSPAPHPPKEPSVDKGGGSHTVTVIDGLEDVLHRRAASTAACASCGLGSAA
eukprot:scaffold17139_cov123-Isochrysis_galbana.AAC.2